MLTLLTKVEGVKGRFKFGRFARNKISFALNPKPSNIQK